MNVRLFLNVFYFISGLKRCLNAAELAILLTIGIRKRVLTISLKVAESQSLFSLDSATLREITLIGIQ